MASKSNKTTKPAASENESVKQDAVKAPVETETQQTTQAPEATVAAITPEASTSSAEAKGDEKPADDQQPPPPESQGEQGQQDQGGEASQQGDDAKKDGDPQPSEQTKKVEDGPAATEAQQETKVEVKTEEVQASKPVETSSVDEVPAAPAKSTLLDELGVESAHELLKDVPEAFQASLHLLVEYGVKMSPRYPVPSDESIALQERLFRFVQNLINRENPHFHPLFTVLLRWMEKHKDGAMHESARFRHNAEMRLTASDTKAFMNLLQLLPRLAPTKSRKIVLTQTNMRAYLQYGLTDSGRARLETYFNV